MRATELASYARHVTWRSTGEDVIMAHRAASRPGHDEVLALPGALVRCGSPVGSS